MWSLTLGRLDNINNGDKTNDAEVMSFLQEIKIEMGRPIY